MTEEEFVSSFKKKPEGVRPLGKPAYSWEANNKTDSHKFIHSVIHSFIYSHSIDHTDVEFVIKYKYKQFVIKYNYK
jgi:hypothetical protein